VSRIFNSIDLSKLNAVLAHGQASCPPGRENAAADANAPLLLAPTSRTGIAELVLG